MDQSRGLREKIDHDQYYRSSNEVSHESFVQKVNAQCIAPTLQDYLEPNGHLKYSPRPEWFQNKVSPAISHARNISPARFHLSASSIESENNRDLIEAPWQNSQLSNQPVWSPPPRILPQMSYRFGRHIFREETPILYTQWVMFEEIQIPDVIQGEHITNDEGSPSGSSASLIDHDSIDSFGGAVFGAERNSALHMAIREGSTEAALTLTELGANPDAPNGKGVTPVILAAQKGNLKVVRSLLHHGADPSSSSFNGTTALIQASHFGHYYIVDYLLKHGALANQSNVKNTTALMRASQEGHQTIVHILLKYKANPNSLNRDSLNSLMLAAQRGHVRIIELLLMYGARLDACTSQNSTALMLACKRGNIQVARILIGRGCDLEVKDSRGRSARDIAMKLEDRNLTDLISHEVQLLLMKRNVATERTYEIMKLWKLLHLRRVSFAHSYAGESSCGERVVACKSLATDVWLCNKQHEVINRLMSLPLSLVGHISTYICLPSLYEKRLEMMTRRCLLNPDSTISCALDLIDDVLEDIGFVQACEEVGITAPPDFKTWTEWRKYRRCGGKPWISDGDRVPLTSTAGEWIEGELRSLQLRRDAGFLQILSYYSPPLSKKMSCSRIRVPETILQRLKHNSDIASVVRRMHSRSVHFDSSVASEIVQLAGALVLWHRSTY